MTMMIRRDLCCWRYFDLMLQEWIVSAVISEVDARLQFPEGAEKVEGSLETRWVAQDETGGCA